MKKMNEKESLDIWNECDLEVVDSLELKDKEIRKITLVFLTLSILCSIFNYFFKNSYNTIFTVPFMVMQIAYTYLLHSLKLDINKKAYYYLIPIFLILGSTIFIKVDITNLILNILIVPVLTSIFFLSLGNKNYQISKKFLCWFGNLFPNKIFYNLRYFKITTKTEANPKNDKIKNILLGVLIAIPFVFILLELLTDGDKYFGAFIEKLINHFFNLFNFSAIKSILVYGIIVFIIFFSVFINLVINKDKKIEEGKKKNINDYVSYTLLAVINFVFALFIISEISKLTTNFLNIPIEYTYAQYAREGFFQLLAVSSINFFILSFFLYYTDALENTKNIKKFLFLLIFFSVFLIGNSFYRMFLYIGAYGFTILRLQVILFLIMELILFFIIAFKLLRKNHFQEAILFTILILTTYIINLYFCTENFVNFLNS